MGLTRNRGPTLRRGLEQGRGFESLMWWRGSDGGEKKRGRGGIPHGSPGVHVARDRLLIQRKYTACSAAVLNPEKGRFRHIYHINKDDIND